jgi:hypothetical protein
VKKVFITIVIIFSGITFLYAWGAWGHKHIGRAAVFALPAEMHTFYYNHIDFITEGSVVPDLRRGVLNDKAEPPRHYIDIEDFGNISVDNLPKTWKEATSKYDSGFLQKTGFLPWYIQTLMDKLTAAFRKKNRSEIIFISAELSHYIADAHVPLHTSSNHDGQLTDQKGIHSFWESQLPELFGNNYNFYTGDAIYINDVSAEILRIIKYSHELAEITLGVERILKNSTSKEKIFESKSPGDTSQRRPRHSAEYAKKYHDALNGMVEKQMRSAVSTLGNFWYTAWVNAGKPDLNPLDNGHLTNQNKKNFKREMKAWKKGKIYNLNVSRDD